MVIAVLGFVAGVLLCVVVKFDCSVTRAEEQEAGDGEDEGAV